MERRTVPRGALLLALAALLALALVGAAARLITQQPPARAALPPPAPITRVATTGIATFYAEDFDGRTMANGATFDMNDPGIAAGNAWPLGTRLCLRRVPGGPWDATLTPEERARYFGRRILVTVTDRGAFTHALDLSRGAFAQLGRPDEGVIGVAIEPLAAGLGPEQCSRAS